MLRQLSVVTVGAVAMTVAATLSAQTVYFVPEDDQPIIEQLGGEPIYYLEFSFERPRWITVDGKRYFFLPYKVVNSTKKKVEYRPDFQLVTNTGRNYVAQFHKAAFEAIRKQIRRDYLVSQLDLNETGVPEGPENARHSVAIWEEFDDRADAFDIYCGSLTNYTPKKVKNPLFSPEKKEAEYFSLSRQVMLRYAFPGNPRSAEPKSATPAKGATGKYTQPDGREKSWPSLQTIKWVWRGSPGPV